MQDLKDVASHFSFGENWASYAKSIGDVKIDEAVAGLRRLTGTADLAGKRFLDIGCGSGIHCLAALRLGATEVVAVDIDADSVATTEATLAKHAGRGAYRVERCSVFDLSQREYGTFDIVYAWGVLHHTGDLVEALSKAASLVGENDMFLFALYRRTYMCPLWRLEKRWYASASIVAQARARSAYLSWFDLIAFLRRLPRTFLALRGATSAQEAAATKDVRAYESNYRARGMEFHHDVHDWLGGFPYESILPDEVEQLMRQLGLRHQASFLCTPKLGKPIGLRGSGCDEYRYVRS